MTTLFPHSIYIIIWCQLDCRNNNNFTKRCVQFIHIISMNCQLPLTTSQNELYRCYFYKSFHNAIWMFNDLANEKTKNPDRCRLFCHRIKRCEEKETIEIFNAKSCGWKTCIKQKMREIQNNNHSEWCVDKCFTTFYSLHSNAILDNSVYKLWCVTLSHFLWCYSFTFRDRYNMRFVNTNQTIYELAKVRICACVCICAHNFSIKC